MRILIVGNGGREHALLWKLRQDAPEAELFITRGNGGTDALAKALPFDPTESATLAAWASAHDVQLTIIGPEAPLADGIVDHFEREGLRVFGPSRAAAAIESSKAFAKALMNDARVPTAAFACFTDAGAAEAFVHSNAPPLVVKASGLAGGKGAVVCPTREEALLNVRLMLREGAFGQAGREIVIEEFLEGEELSVLALTDGEHALPLVPAQDHKRIGEGDTGANTGGMGAYAPVSLATPELLERVQREILLPTLAVLRERNRRFRGVLYAGLMLTAKGPRVIEFNARFGDPETQAILPLLASSLLEPMVAIARGESIAGMTIRRRPGAAVTTVLAAAGYPGTPVMGKPIRIPARLEEAGDVIVFHAGTRRVDGELVSSGGRVLAVTAVADTLGGAAERSRAAADAIAFDGKQYRRDIGWRELQRQSMVAPSA